VHDYYSSFSRWTSTLVRVAQGPAAQGLRARPRPAPVIRPAPAPVIRPARCS
jgi:hypothetical protein